MVSTMCWWTLSRWPLVSNTALIPPWAQTEWERFTSNREKSSTAIPASAMRTVAHRPPKPPPMTMTLGFLSAVVI